VIGAQSSIWTLLPVFAALLLAAYLVTLGMRRRKRFFVGLTVGCALAALYIFVPFKAAENDNAFRRATIAERFHRPAGRLEEFKTKAENSSDPQAIQRIRLYEWLIADTRGYAPNDFPYLPANELVPGPSQLVKNAAAAQANGDLVKAATLLESGKQQHEFARCELSTNLAVIYYTSGRREQALQELEAVQPLVDRTSSPGCIKSQFLLGSLYRELDRTADANRTFASFLANSDGTNDQELIALRKQLGK
jgi:tetratricopeptide (TPR) repeat protein